MTRRRTTEVFAAMYPRMHSGDEVREAAGFEVLLGNAYAVEPHLLRDYVTAA